MSVPIGFRFHPTKEEVIISYLGPAIHGDPLPADDVLLKIDIYGEKREPWNLFDKDSESSFWVFTKLKKRNASMIDRVAGCGSWVNQNFHEIRNSDDGKLLGFDKYFRFECKKFGGKSKRGNINGNWTMHEYSLADKGLSDYVICEIKNKDAVDGKARKRAANIDDHVNYGGILSATKKVCVDHALDASNTSNLNFGEFVHQDQYQNQIMDHWSQRNSCSPQQGNYTDAKLDQPNKDSSSPVEFANNGSVCSDLINGNELKSFASELEAILSIPATSFVDQTMIRNCNPLQASNFNDNQLESFVSELEDLLSVPDECNIGSSICAVNSGFGDQENQNPNLVDDETMIGICNPFLF
ncbi:No apical meristem (NAM) protein [Corchorus olitorius]|uniref:No apical meristem (NAM) protein n=1 Tax=Corchorus olitorius TaxID=93759 RepID=A0A1R3FV92_9ROSI|nr:No apical meristem (NAM) protein [Corchorus olitorius]